MTSVSLDFALQSFQFAVTRHFDEFSANYDKWSNFLSKVPELYNSQTDIFVTLAQLFVYKFTVPTRRVRKEGGNFKHISRRLPFGNPLFLFWPKLVTISGEQVIESY